MHVLKRVDQTHHEALALKCNGGWPGAKFEVAEAWMRMRRLPPALHEKIVSFYQDVWIMKQGAPLAIAHRSVSDKAVSAALPHTHAVSDSLRTCYQLLIHVVPSVWALVCNINLNGLKHECVQRRH